MRSGCAQRSDDLPGASDQGCAERGSTHVAELRCSAVTDASIVAQATAPIEAARALTGGLARCYGEHLTATPYATREACEHISVDHRADLETMVMKNLRGPESRTLPQASGAS